VHPSGKLFSGKIFEGGEEGVWWPEVLTGVGSGLQNGRISRQGGRGEAERAPEMFRVRTSGRMALWGWYCIDGTG